MTTIPEVQDLAADLQAERPDWPDIIPIVNHLLPWRHVLPYDQLHDMAIAWVTDHGNRTPASLKYMPGVPLKQAGGSSSGRKSKEHRCYICGRKRGDCLTARDFEVANNIPDPHDFETKEQAEAGRARHQIDAKTRARADAEEARRKVAWQDDLDPELIDRRIQEPEPEETPA